MDLEGIVKLISSKRQTEHSEVEIWDKIVHYFCENLDKNDLDQICILSNSKLGTSTVHSTKDYFDALANCFSDKNDILEFLINLMGYMEFHTEEGATNVEKHLTIYRNGLQKIQAECMKSGVFKDIYFVGRKEEIEEIKKVIKEGQYNGVLLCGLGGMGKTSLATRVCYDLHGEKIKIELREHKTFRHFLQSMVNSIPDLRGSTSGQIRTSENNANEETLDEEDILQRTILSYLFEKKHIKRVFLLDNMEDVTANISEKIKAMKFFKLLLESLLKGTCKTRFIITSQDDFVERVEDDGNSKDVNEVGIVLNNFIKKITIGQLDETSARDLVKKSIKSVKGCLTDDQIDAVIRWCLCCPFALRVICDIINTSVGDITSLLELNSECISTLDLLRQCISKSFQKLGRHSSVLCQISLFGTSKFDLTSAALVVYGERNKQRDDLQQLQNTKDLQFKLLLFKSHHLLEIENQSAFQNKKNSCNQRGETLLLSEAIFSLHPLVHSFLLDKIDDDEFCDEYKRAKNNFLSMLHDIVVEIGHEYDRDVFKARQMAESKRMLIMKYLTLVEECDELTQCSGMHTFISGDKIESINNTIKMNRNPEDHVSYIKNICSKTFDNEFIRYSWKLEYVSALINYDNISYKKALRKLEKVEKQLKKIPLNDDQKVQIFILQGRILYYKGYVLSETCINDEESRNYLRKAETKFTQKQTLGRSESKSYLANIYNCEGNLLYRENNIESVKKAIIMHKKALDIMKEINANILNENAVSFLANISTCHFRLASLYKNDRYEDAEKKAMEYAEKTCEESINIAISLRMENTDFYLKKLKFSANQFNKLNRFTKADTMFTECLKVCRIVHGRNSLKEILIMHDHGKMFYTWLRLKHKDCDQEGEGPDQYDLVVKGLLIYDEIKDILALKSDLILGSVYINKIKKYHLIFLRAQRDKDAEKDAQQFYNTLCCRIMPSTTTELASSTSNPIDSSSSDDSSSSIDDITTSLDRFNITDDSSSNYGSTSPVETNIPTQQQHSLNQNDELENPLLEMSECVDKRTARSKATQESMDVCPLDTAIEDRNPALETQSKRPKLSKLRLDFAQKRENRVRSNSSSGVSSMGDITPFTGSFDKEKNFRLFSRGESGDDVFPPVQKILEDNEDVNVAQKRKSIDECREMKRPKIQKQLSTSTFPDQRSLDSIIDELRNVKPFTDPGVRDLVKELEIGNAKVIGDSKGRPIVQYSSDKE